MNFMPAALSSCLRTSFRAFYVSVKSSTDSHSCSSTTNPLFLSYPLLIARIRTSFRSRSSTRRDFPHFLILTLLFPIFLASFPYLTYTTSRILVPHQLHIAYYHCYHNTIQYLRMVAINIVVANHCQTYTYHQLSYLPRLGSARPRLCIAVPSRHACSSGLLVRVPVDKLLAQHTQHRYSTCTRQARYLLLFSTTALRMVALAVEKSWLGLRR